MPLTYYYPINTLNFNQGESHMDIFTQLAEAVRTQQQEGDLPDFLAPEILAVTENAQRYKGQEDLVVELLKRVNGV